MNIVSPLSMVAVAACIRRLERIAGGAKGRMEMALKAEFGAPLDAIQDMTVGMEELVLAPRVTMCWVRGH